MGTIVNMPKKSRITKASKSNLSTQAEIIRADQAISKEVAECLTKHYPDHMWGVHASVEQGMVDILNLDLDGEFGFRIRMAEMINDPSMKMVIRGGGELLERFNITRGAAKENELLDMKQNFDGKNVHD